MWSRHPLEIGFSPWPSGFAVPAFAMGPVGKGVEDVSPGVRTATAREAAAINHADRVRFI
jgi:hypothetical protein